MDARIVDNCVYSFTVNRHTFYYVNTHRISPYIMTTATQLEERLRLKPNDFVLKRNEGAKSDVWKHFSLLFEKVDSELIEKTYFCVCNRCRRVYAYKSASGGSFGTKNLLDHVRLCRPISTPTDTQLKLAQCVRQNPQLAKVDVALMKRKEVEYCVEGYHSFRSVEHSGLRNLLQTCVDFGAKYCKFDVNDVLSGRNAVSRETHEMSLLVKKNIKERLKEEIDDGTVSLCLDLYTDDYRKKAFLDVHATWADRTFTLHHAALAIRHFGIGAHTGDNISTLANVILAEYGLPEEETPVTTDHGSNVVAALRSNIRLDCLCHRLHTVLETAWKETKTADPEAAEYETAVSDLCRYVKQATGIQEQLPVSLKHGGDTRPWISMYRRAQSVETSYETLASVLTARGMHI